MTNKNNIPKGFKDSAVGIIPKEWDVKRLVDLCYNTGYYGINAPAVTYCDSLPTYLRITDIDNYGKFIKTNKVSVNHPDSAKFILKDNDIVFARTGATVGKTYLYNPNDGLLVYAGFLICFSINTQKAISYYVKTYTDTSTYWNWVKIISQRSGQPGINAIEFSSIQLPIPPLEEQRKIAEILETWDEAIEKQSKLIEKLELRKRGIMQRLLTGRTRLPGFTTPWKKVKLGEIGTFLSTNTLSRDKLNDNNGNIQNIHYGDILVKYSSIVDVKLTAIPYVNEDVAVSSDYLENGDIVFSDTAEDNIVGKAIEISNIADKKMVAGLHTMLFRPNKGSYAQHFLGYYLNSDAYRKQLAPLIQGIKVCSISKKAICHTIVLTPSLPEQKAIAEVLTMTDDEIATHRKKLDALRQQKRSLMQQLLTGKTRVKI